MSFYHFARLIEKYGTSFTVDIPSQGHYIAGDWIQEQGETQSCFGAILPLTSQKLYQSGGVLTKKDRQLVMLEPLPKNFGEITIKDIRYTVEQDADYSDFSDIYGYMLKAVAQ